MGQKITTMNITGGGTQRVEMEIYNSYYELTRVEDKQGIVSKTDTEHYLSLEPDQFTRSKIVSMIADTVDSSSSNQVRKRKSKHNCWDVFVVPSNYFFSKQKEIRTTIGRFMFSKYVLQGAGIIEQVGFVDDILGRSGLEKVNTVVVQLYMDDRINRKQFNDYVDRRDNLGYWLNAMLAHTISLRMAKPLKEIEKLKQELYKKYEKELAAKDITVMNKIEAELIAKAKELLRDDPGMNLYDSGDLNFGNNYKNNAILKGPILNNITGEYDFVKTSFMEGIDIHDLPAHANSVVSGSYPGAIMTREAGYLGKQLLALLQMAETDEPGTDCGTKALIPIKVTPPPNGSAENLLFSYFLDNNELKLLTPENLNRYTGKVLLFRSPMGCITPKICSKCAGDLFYKMDIRKIGLFAVQLSHSNLNLSLKTKHNQSISSKLFNPATIIEDL